MRTNRTGEKRIMQNGMAAEIIVYRGCLDIDVRFSDGYIVKNRSYAAFNKGLIHHPLLYKFERLGEKRTMDNGMEAEIIAYRNSMDIDVRFSDGSVVTNKLYHNFRTGKIGHPKFKTPPTSRKTERVGETRMMSCGMKATIVAYRGIRDMDVLFEDGSLHSHCRYDAFKKGYIAPLGGGVFVANAPVCYIRELHTTSISN